MHNKNHYVKIMNVLCIIKQLYKNDERVMYDKTIRLK